jgi:hypothetical protein
MDSAAKTLAVTFVMNSVLAFIALSLVRGNGLTWILPVALAATAVNYLLGEIIILPSFGNTVASAAQGLTAMLVAHVAGVLLLGFRTSYTSLILFGILVAIGQYIFHNYTRHTVPKR